MYTVVMTMQKCITCKTDIYMRPDNCQTGIVKLVDGNIESEGRVEYCHNGGWSALCTSYTMSQVTASRICSQLGYKQPNCKFKCLT